MTATATTGSSRAAATSPGDTRIPRVAPAPPLAVKSTRRRLRASAPAASAGSLLVLAVLVQSAAVIRPGTRDLSWWYQIVASAAPASFTAVLMVAAVPLVLLLGRGTRWDGRAVDGALVLVFAAYAFSTRVSAVTGDQDIWRATAASRDVPISEPLAAVIEKIPVALTGSTAALDWIAPAFGLFAVIAYLRLAHTIAGGDPHLLTALRAGFFATCLPFFYIVGYVENTFLAVPPFLLAIDALIRWTRTGSPRSITSAGVLAGVSCLLHGSFAVETAGLAVFVVLHSRGPASAIRPVLLLLAAWTAAIAVFLAIVAVGPARITIGNAVGGGDGQMLTPFVATPLTLPGGPLFFSSAHAIQTADILLAASPVLAPLAAVLLPLTLRRPATAALLAPPLDGAVMRLLAVLSLCYAAFVGCWGFDLGTAGDLDLMLTGGVPLALLVVLIVAARVRRPEVLVLLVSVSAVVGFLFYGAREVALWT